MIDELEALLRDLILEHRHIYDGDCGEDYGCSCHAPREITDDLLSVAELVNRKWAKEESDAWYRANPEVLWDGPAGDRWYAEHLASVIRASI